MNEIFFSSDLHFCHDKEFLYKPRGFSSVTEMNEQLIENFTKKLHYTDSLYLLGDLMLNDDLQGMRLLKSIPCKKYIIIGNHDTITRVKSYSNTFNCEVLGYADVLKISKRKSFYLSHYPTMMGNFDEQKKICLHGHTHSKDKLQYSNYGCINVALDAWNNEPVSLSEIYDCIEKLNY